MVLEALRELEQSQIDFICEECQISEDELYNMDESTLIDVVYEKMCDIEIEELIDGGESETETERCIAASDIVTALGNALAEERGLLAEE